MQLRLKNVRELLEIAYFYIIDIFYESFQKLQNDIEWKSQNVVLTC